MFSKPIMTERFPQHRQTRYPKIAVSGHQGTTEHHKYHVICDKVHSPVGFAMGLNLPDP